MIEINGSFEGGHYDAGVSLQIPNGWMFDAADDATPNPISPDDWNRFVMPEVRVLPANQLPPHEQAIFVLDGAHCLKVFKGHGAWLGRFAQLLTLESGVYKFTVKLWPDLVKSYDGGKQWADDPNGNDGLVRFVLNDNGHDWQSVAPPPPGETQNLTHWRVFEFEFFADGETEIAIDLMCPFALDNSGFFADGWTLEQIASTPPPDCRGGPREQYRRIVNVLPAHATLEQATEVFQTAWRRGRETVGGSYDDAGIGDLDDRRAVLYGIDELERPNFTAFYEEWYPGVEVVFRPLPGEPEPPDPEPPRPYTYITWHTQNTYSGILNHVRRLADAGKPLRWFKIVHVNMQLADEIKAVSPETAVVFRHVDDDVGKYRQIAASQGYDAAARHFLDRFISGVMDVSGIDYVESLNEIIGTHDPTGVEFAVNFDVAFLRVLADITQGDVRGGVLTAAAGNPDHPEVAWMLDAARAAVQYGALVMPHSYFAARPDPGVPEAWMVDPDVACDYSMRYQLSWDPVFVANGLQLTYASGEYGAVGVHLNPDGTPGGFAGPEIGWKSSTCLNGNLPRYVDLILMNLRQREEWNASHGWRDWGPAIFTTGGGDKWDHFEFNSGEWSYLIDRLTEGA